MAKANTVSAIPQYSLHGHGSLAGMVLRHMEHIYEQAKGQPDQPHRHDYYTVIWMQQGQGSHHIDFKEYPLQNNALFFVGPGQVHQLVATAPPKGLVLLFTPEFLAHNGIRADFISDLHLFTDCDDNPPLFPDAPTVARLNALVQQMQATSHQPQAFQYDLLGAQLKQFLIVCHQFYLSQRPYAQNTESGNDLVRSFKALVEEHFRQWHKVQQYAAQLAVTAGHLNDVLHQQAGVGAKEYIQNRLVLEAKRQALFTNEPAKNTGYELGFDDPAHFSKVFKNVAGMPFQAFRDQTRKKYNHSRGFSI